MSKRPFVQTEQRRKGNMGSKDHNPDSEAYTPAHVGYVWVDTKSPHLSSRREVQKRHTGGVNSVAEMQQSTIACTRLACWHETCLASKSKGNDDDPDQNPGLPSVLRHHS